MRSVRVDRLSPKNVFGGPHSIRLLDLLVFFVGPIGGLDTPGRNLCKTAFDSARTGNVARQRCKAMLPGSCSLRSTKGETMDFYMLDRTLPSLLNAAETFELTIRSSPLRSLLSAANQISRMAFGMTCNKPMASSPRRLAVRKDQAPSPNVERALRKNAIEPFRNCCVDWH